MIPTQTRAVIFDAVGTLLHPRPPAIEVYLQIGAKHGSRLSRDQVAQRFRDAFQNEEVHDQRNHHCTNEAREHDRWRRIVGHCLPDVTDFDACFRELFDHFASPDAWELPSGIEQILTELRQRGLQLGIGSNYDRRLRSVVAGIGALQSVEHLIISSEVGWKKPAPQFFEAIATVLNEAPQQILFIGDDLANDYDAARRAGLSALLYDSKDEAAFVASRITTFEQLR